MTYGTDWTLKLPMYVTGVYGARMLGTHLVALLLLACGGGLVAAVRNGTGAARGPTSQFSPA